MEEIKYIDGYKNGNISYKFVDSSATKNIGVLNNKLNNLSDKLESIKEEIIKEVEGGASDQYDTFKEIEDILKSGFSLAEPILLTEEELEEEYGIIISTTEGV